MSANAPPTAPPGDASAASEGTELSSSEGASPERAARSPYEKPALRRLGSVKDLTFALRNLPSSDGGGKMAVFM